jgi:transposase
MSQIQIITGVDRRRRWSDEQKQAIIAAAFAPGAVVSAVARQVDVNSGQIYRWRRELRAGSSGFAEVVVSPGSVPPDRSAVSVIDVELDGGVRVRLPASISPELAAAVLAALVRR